MILLVSSALAVTVQVVAPSGRVLAEQPITDAAEAVFRWRGERWKVEVAAREGGWDSELARWEDGAARGGSMFAMAPTADGCNAMTAGRERDALTLVISERPTAGVAADCFVAPVPFVGPIARLAQGRWESGKARPELRLHNPAGAVSHFALLDEGSKLDWRMEDADGVEWVAQVGVTAVGDTALETLVAWRRADPVLFWRPTTRTVATTLPYGEEVTLAGPVALAARAEAPR